MRWQEWSRYLGRLIYFAAWPVFQTSHQLGTPAGYLMLALFLLLLLTVALPAVKHRRPAELNLAVLAAFALFVFIEGTLLVLATTFCLGMP
jgi:hypothetical protein